MEEKLKEEIDNMDLPELLDFVGFRNSYKDMMDSYDKIVAEAELKAESRKEEEQLKYIEEKEKNK